MATLVELYKPGDDETHVVKSGQSVTGKRLVEQTADFEVQHAGANSRKVVGAARYDAAAGAYVAVVSHGVVPLVASGTVAAGDPIAAAATGLAKAIAAAGGTYAAADTDALAGKVGRARTGAADGQEFFAKLDL